MDGEERAVGTWVFGHLLPVLVFIFNAYILLQ